MIAVAGLVSASVVSMASKPFTTTIDSPLALPKQLVVTSKTADIPLPALDGTPPASTAIPVPGLTEEVPSAEAPAGSTTTVPETTTSAAPAAPAAPAPAAPAAPPATPAPAPAPQPAPVTAPPATAAPLATQAPTTQPAAPTSLLTPDYGLNRASQLVESQPTPFVSKNRGNKQ